MTDRQFITRGPVAQTQGLTWNPIIGEEAHRFLDQKPPDIRTRLQDEAVRVLGRCVRPRRSLGEHSRSAGLVLGYVQSGKTSSFTTVTALARDNGFKLIVVMAGTTELLQDQTIKRLTSDLGLGEMDAWRRWIALKNPSLANDEGAQLRVRLADLSDARSAENDLGIPLVIVMKQHVHLSNLAWLLESIHGLEGISALLIDDEAHMHSPNVGVPGKPSTTYVQLKRLRDALPVHSLLQYTATPQAPLLANITDELSPEFVCLLEPGIGYTGGQYFFVDHHDEFVRMIGSDELYALDTEEFAEQGAPKSLRRAFVTYLLNCAVMRSKGQHDHRTMLVHPDPKKKVQAAWFNSIEAMKAEFFSMIDTRDEPDFSEWIEDEVSPVWADLLSTCDDLPLLDDLVPHLRSVLTLLVIKKVNSSGPAEVPWHVAPYWVLVGGNLLGVGFTVEGLCVTHMMRAPGTKLADTIQQRARFFGYKSEYEVSCRAWMPPELDAAFIDYVKHEKAIRDSLGEFDHDVRPLREWKRVFLLDPGLRLTRRAAHKLTLATFTLQEGWCFQRRYREADQRLFNENREEIDQFLGSLQLELNESISGDTDATRHYSAICSPHKLRELLAQLRYSLDDDPKFNALNFLLAQAADDWGEGFQECLVVQMAADSPERRTRGVKWEMAEQLRIGEVTLHQGRNPRSGPVRYQGDNKARDDGRVTLQIHRLDLLDGASGPPLTDARDTPFVAVYVPSTLQSAVLSEV